MDNKERGRRIRQQIVRDVIYHPNDISRHIANMFSISTQAVNSHLRRLEKEGRVQSHGVGKGKTYFIGDIRENNIYTKLAEGFHEDTVFRNHFAFIFDDLPENIKDICHYGFTEMVNNVIDHSGSEEIFIDVTRNVNQILILVVDYGEGIFRKISRLCHLSDERQALLELSKGKLTTDPTNHTGEGIFFTSRVFDKFIIDSKGITFNHDDDFDFDFIIESKLLRENVGTLVGMLLQRNSKRTIQDVFEEYAGPDEFQFNKTVIPVRLAQYGSEKLISRSQAKRLLLRVERFKYVIFDFDDVSMIGQAFADEIFRVYANNNPDITMVATNMVPDVEKMIDRAKKNKRITDRIEKM